MGQKKFKAYPIGYFHIDVAEVRPAEGKLHPFVAMDRTSKFAYVELHYRATRSIAKRFLLKIRAEGKLFRCPDLKPVLRLL